ncbi:hypothetical protein YC2023_088880 [Brassica napus]
MSRRRRESCGGLEQNRELTTVVYWRSTMAKESRHYCFFFLIKVDIAVYKKDVLREF